MMLNEKEFNAFKYEIENWNNIPLTSKRCGVGCLFCKLTGDPILKRFPELPPITLKELYKGFEFVDRNYKYVRLGAGVMVATQTDPFLHENIYEFIEHTCRYFPENMVTTVSTGSYIDLNKLDFLNSLENYKIDLSLITMQKQREYLMKKSTKEKLNVILREGPLNKISLMFTGDIEALKRDLELLINLDLHKKGGEILVRRIEHTKFSNDLLKSISNKSIEGFGECAEFLKQNYPFVKYTVPSLEDTFKEGTAGYIINANQVIEKIKDLLCIERNSKFLIASPQSSYNFFKEAIKGFSNMEIIEIKNGTYGGSLTVAGLLTNSDIIEQVNKVNDYDYMILPKEMYDKESLDLIGNSKSDLEKHFNVSIICL